MQKRELRTTVQLGVFSGVTISALLGTPRRHSLTIANICSYTSGEPAAQSDVGNGERFVGRKPSGVGAFAFARMRIIVAGEQHIPQVKVPVPARPGVHVDMDELRAVVRVRDCETELFLRLAHCRIGGVFSLVDVPAWLQPQAEPLVHVQHDAASPDDDG